MGCLLCRNTRRLSTHFQTSDSCSGLRCWHWQPSTAGLLLIGPVPCHSRVHRPHKQLPVSSPCSCTHKTLAARQLSGVRRCRCRHSTTDA